MSFNVNKLALGKRDDIVRHISGRKSCVLACFQECDNWQGETSFGGCQHYQQVANQTSILIPGSLSRYIRGEQPYYDERITSLLLGNVQLVSAYLPDSGKTVEYFLDIVDRLR